MDFILGFLLGVVVGMVVLAYGMTKKVRTHDYTFVVENGRGGGKWVDRAKRYLDGWLEHEESPKSS